MNVLFLNIDEHVDMIRTTLSLYVRNDDKIVFDYFDSMNNLKFKNYLQDINVIFYQMQDASLSSEVERMNKAFYKSVKRVAICSDYKQGMNAVNNGSSYALLLPLKAQDIMACCEFLAKDG